MLRYADPPFQKTNDLMKIYRQAFEKVKYLKDFDDKLLSYNEVITYCADSKLCRKDDSIKRNQILFWTYNNIGDIFLEKNASEFKNDNYLFAVQYYQNALEFSKTEQDRFHTLEKIAHIYLELQDETNWRRTIEQIAFLSPDEDKRASFVHLADGTDDPRLQAKYLEAALNFVADEKTSVQEKCAHTLQICTRLLEIYRFGERTKDYDRIKNLQEKTIELLN